VSAASDPETPPCRPPYTCVAARDFHVPCLTPGPKMQGYWDCSQASNECYPDTVGRATEAKGRPMPPRLAARACAILVLVLATGVPSVAAGAEECVPSFRWVAEAPVTARADGGNWAMSMEAALIGCDAQLASITPAEQGAILELLKKIILEEHYKLLARRNHTSFRAAVVARINQLLKRPSVTDFLVTRLSTSETAGS
jgi:hypothetical protein